MAVCKFGILTGLLLHTENGTAEILGDTRDWQWIDKAGFYCIWQAWSLVFLPTKIIILLKIIFFISLKTTKITSKIQISGHVTYSFINMLFISTGNFYDKLRPQILLVGTTTNSPLNPCLNLIIHVIIHVLSEI
jgi:hypothetical protein